VLVRVEQEDGEGASPRFLVARRSKRWREIGVISLACLVAVACAGCSKSTDRSPSILLRHEISLQPTRIGPATVTIRLTDIAGKPVAAAQIAMEGDMSHPGMSPAFGQVKELEAGRYQGQIDFAMAGDWTLLFHITLADGRKLDRQVSVPAVRAN
jgi:YtkA-like